MEVVPFREVINGITIRRYGFQVGEWLAVSWASNADREKYRIFSVITGKPVIPNKFPDKETALEVADLLANTYKKYWEINEIYPDLDIIGVARWDFPNGVQWHLALSALKDKDTINVTDITEQFKLAEPEAKRVTRNYAYS